MYYTFSSNQKQKNMKTKLFLIAMITSLTMLSQPLQVSLTATNVTCQGYGDGMVDAAVDFGTTPYTYSWSSGTPKGGKTGIFLLSPGTYTVTVTDASNATVSMSATVTESATTLTIGTPTVVSGQTVCQGQSTSLSVTGGGGSAPYIFYWQAYPDSLPGSSVNFVAKKTATYYGYILDNNGCKKQTAGVTVTVNPLPTGPITGPTSFCKNDSAILQATGLAGYSYAWVSPSASTQDVTVKTAGTYSVNITTNKGCTKSFSQTMTVNPLPAEPTVVDNGNVLFSSTAKTYQWYWNNTIMAGETSQVCIPPYNTGTYTVDITNSYGCHADSKPYSISTGINELQDQPKFKATIIDGQFNFTSDRPTSIRLFDISGNLVYSGKTEALALPLAASGIYILNTDYSQVKLMNVK